MDVRGGSLTFISSCESVVLIHRSSPRFYRISTGRYRTGEWRQGDGRTRLKSGQGSGGASRRRQCRTVLATPASRLLCRLSSRGSCAARLAGTGTGCRRQPQSGRPMPSIAPRWTPSDSSLRNDAMSQPTPPCQLRRFTPAIGITPMTTAARRSIQPCSAGHSARADSDLRSAAARNTVSAYSFASAFRRTP